MKVFIVDFMNMVHRSRAGFGERENAIAFMFNRIFRKAVADFSPDKIYIVQEGRPQHRRELLTTYKESRSSLGNDFWSQVELIKRGLESMPVTLVRHPTMECDDVIAHLVSVSHAQDECVVVSTDTDFIQLLDKSNRVKLWNPVKKKMIEHTEYDYVRWKALTGDKADDIPGIKGIGAKTAQKLLENPQKLEQKLNQNDNREVFERNIKLIQFSEINEQDLEIMHGKCDWNYLRMYFKSLGFFSITNDKSWKTFVNTFSNIT